MNNANRPAYCGDCGRELARVHGTAYVQCCTGRWYWVKAAPLPKDDCKQTRWNGYYRYERLGQTV